MQMDLNTRLSGSSGGTQDDREICGSPKMAEAATLGAEMAILEMEAVTLRWRLQHRRWKQ